MKAREINVDDFVASDAWVYNFKRDFKIFSRKVTKLITKQNFNQIGTDSEVSRIFLQNVKRFKNENNVSQANIINTDQSGFNSELHSPRTLSHVGEKSTMLCVNSIHSTTHSYTIQPIITLA